MAEDMAGRDLGRTYAGVGCVLTKPKEWEALPDEEKLDAIGRNESRWYGSREGNDAFCGCSLFKKDSLRESCVGGSAL